MGFHDGLEAGNQLDFYRIEAPVARSGMASIYRAVDQRDGRIVALKIPHPELEADPVLFDRFQREAAIGERLDHPKVMRVFGEDGRSRLYMVMEWCDGRLLRQILEEGPLPQERALRHRSRNSGGARVYPRARRGSSRSEAGERDGGQRTTT